ncbi:hypothetical protein AALI21_02785 [Corynebacteriaceae bacterium 6-324]
MNVFDLRRAVQVILGEMEEAIAAVLKEMGVPTGATTLYEFVEVIYPIVEKARREIFAEQTLLMGWEIAEHGLELKPAPLREYFPAATYKTLASALNIGSDKRSYLYTMDYLDDVSRELAGEKILVTDDNRFDPEVMEEGLKRISAAVERHARDAGRQAVIDTKNHGIVRESRNEVQPDDYRGSADSGGVVLGWARILVGESNCSMCAMLASRGPVYDEDTVLVAGRGTREGQRYHENCDCEAVLVIKGRKWEGEKEYKRLKKIWDSSRDNPTDEEVEQGLEYPIDRFTKRWREADQKSFAPQLA